MNYYKNDIRHIRGDTYSSCITVEGLKQAPDRIDFICKENLNDEATILFEKNINSGVSLIEYEEEDDIYKYALRIDPEDTQDIQAGTYYYDLKIEVNSDVFTIMRGRFIVEQNCGRGD